jgi:hypothetical protein
MNLMPATMGYLYEDPKRQQEEAVSQSPIEWATYFTERLTAHEQAFDRMDKSFLRFRTWVTTIIGIVGGIIGIAGWNVVSATWSLQRELGKTEQAITNQTALIEKLDKRFDEVKSLGDKLDRVSEGLNRLQGRLDRDAAAPATKPGAP